MVGIEWNGRNNERNKNGYERIRNNERTEPRNNEPRRRNNHPLVRTYRHYDDPLCVGDSYETFTTENIQLDHFTIHCRWFLDLDTLKFRVKTTLRYVLRDGHKFKTFFEFLYDPEGRNVLEAIDELTCNTPLNFADRVNLLEHMEVIVREVAQRVLDELNDRTNSE